MFGTHYYPHFSRLCAINGANVVAVDASSQRGLDEAMFTWAAADLIKVVLGQGLRSLPVLQGKEFDVVHSSDFVGFNPCPTLWSQLFNHGTRVDEFEKLFFQQAGELLTEGGVMYLGNHDKKGYFPILHTRRGNNIVQL
jgi:hypothetical protein